MRLYYNDNILEDEHDYNFQPDLPEADQLEIRLKESTIIRQRFTPKLYDLTPIDVALCDYVKERLEKIKNDN